MFVTTDSNAAVESKGGTVKRLQLLAHRCLSLPVGASPAPCQRVAFGGLSLSSHALLLGYFPKSGMPKSYIRGLSRNRN